MTDHEAPIHPTEARPPSAAHPDPETWIAYAAGEATTGVEDLQDHLAHCRRCLDLVLDLNAFAAPAGPDRGVAELEKAAVWRTLRRSLQGERRGRWPAMAAIAASLVAALGLGSWTLQQRTIGRLEDRIADLSRPRADVVIRELNPGARQRGAGSADAGAANVADLGLATAPITLVLHLTEPAEYPDYRLDVLDAGGTRVWSRRGLAPSEVDSFYLSLPPHALASGRYELRLFGVDAGREDLLETYPIRLGER